MSQPNLKIPEKAKALANKKVILGGLSLVMALMVISVCSFIPYIIKPENLTSTKFITDSLINGAITILCMVATMFIGQASNAQDPRSNIAKSTAKFLKTRTEIDTVGIFGFKQWIKKVQQPRDIRDSKEQILLQEGIDDFSVLDLSIPQIKLLTTAQIYDNIPYPALTERQIKTVIYVKEHGVKYKLVPPEYYLSAKSIADKKNRSERAANEGKKKALILVVSVSSKVVISLVFSAIFAMLVRDVLQEINPTEAIATLFSRLLNFFTSVFMGYLVGCQINDIDSEYIDMKEQTQREYLDDKEFKPQTIKELAKEQVLERMKEEQRQIPMGLIPVDDNNSN
jgi:hypothetical protein